MSVTSESIDGFLIVRLSSVGDVVLTEPVVAALRERFPDARIGFVVKRRFADLVSGNTEIDHVHLLESTRDGMRRLGAELAAASYRTVIDLHSNVRSRTLCRAAAAERVLRYRKRNRLDGFRVRVLKRPFRAPQRLVVRYLEALEPLGIDGTYRRPRFHVRPSDATRAEERLREAGLLDAPLLVVVPGSVWPTKRWPSDRFAAAVSEAARRWSLTPVALGVSDEHALCDDVVSGVPGSWNAAGLLSLGESAAVVARARVFLGSDSGPTHIARALGRPTVAIFGPTDPGQFSFDGCELLYADLGCSACSFYGGRRCRLGHWDCMRSIDVEAAVAAIGRLVERGRGACASS